MKSYLIPRWCHYSIHGVRFITAPRSICFDFVLTNDSKYISHGLNEKDRIQLENQINKIAGISFDLLGKNSARLGYRYNQYADSFEITPYYHIGGKRVFNENDFHTIQKDTIYRCKIELSNTNIYITVTEANKRRLVFGRVIESGVLNTTIGRRQYPYFGGDGPGSSAPSNIRIIVGFRD